MSAARRIGPDFSLRGKSQRKGITTDFPDGTDKDFAICVIRIIRGKNTFGKGSVRSGAENGRRLSSVLGQLHSQWRRETARGRRENLAPLDPYSRATTVS